MYLETRTQWNIYGRMSLRKSSKTLIKGVRLGSNYAFSGSFLQYKMFTECQHLSNIVRVSFRNLTLIFLFFELIKSMLV